MTKISGTVLAARIAEGKLTAEEKQLVEKQKAKSKENLSIWKKQQEAKKEFGRGFQIELEKEKRVQQGLPEYDVQPNTKPAKRTGRGKATTAAEIKEKQEGSRKLGELRKENNAKAKALNNPAPTPAPAPKATVTTTTNTAKKDITALHEKITAKAQGTQEFGGKTIFDKETQKFVSQSADDVAKDALSKGNKVKSFKTNFLKGKGGKLGLIAAAVALVGAGATWIYNKITENKGTEEPAKANTTPAPTTPVAPKETKKAEDKTPVAKAEETDKTEKAEDKTPVAKAEETEKTEKAEKAEDKTPVAKTDKENNAGKTVPADYVVKPGDCVWNIAKQHLKDINADKANYKPTNAEILKHTKELMELNQLVFEEDGYHVMIKPNDSLKLVA